MGKRYVLASMDVVIQGTSWECAHRYLRSKGLRLKVS